MTLTRNFKLHATKQEMELKDLTKADNNFTSKHGFDDVMISEVENTWFTNGNLL